LRYGLAGFPGSVNGFWAFVDIGVGDYVSFLYGARVFNLYRVVGKAAYRGAERLPPWPPLRFRSGRVYYFPFRLFLEPVRVLEEPMVRPEFAYVAENLLLRGGYRKTHFQADAVTFYNVSLMGSPFGGALERLDVGGEVYTPRIVFRRGLARPPESFMFREVLLQSLVRRYLSVPENLGRVLEPLGVGDVEGLEVLGEKAFPEGHVDIFIKDRHPDGFARKFVVEVKVDRVAERDLEQLRRYMAELGGECGGGVLVGRRFSRGLAASAGRDVVFLRYRFRGVDPGSAYTYPELLGRLVLERV